MISAWPQSSINAASFHQFEAGSHNKTLTRLWKEIWKTLPWEPQRFHHLQKWTKIKIYIKTYVPIQVVTGILSHQANKSKFSLLFTFCEKVPRPLPIDSCPNSAVFRKLIGKIQVLATPSSCIPMLVMLVNIQSQITKVKFVLSSQDCHVLTLTIVSDIHASAVHSCP